jgi:carbamate kinase
LDYCGADTQGSIGYMFQQALYNEFRHRKMQKSAVTVVTQTIVDRNDPAFQNPSKPIGSFMDEEQAKMRMEKDGWTVVEDAGRGWRRVVPSPIPLRIVEADAINALIEKGFVVIGVGGGGIPVIETPEGKLVGVEAVIDKDFGAAILASMLKADLFLISTAVEKVAINFNKPNQQWLDQMTAAEARQYVQEGHFAKGSMLPKIQAILKYLDNGGKKALITDPAHIKDALNGKTGTWILP